MKRVLVSGLALLASSPLAAQNIVTDETDLSEQRLRVCLSTGAPGAPRESLTGAVTALRSLCYSQILRVREQRWDEADERLRLPSAGLTPNDRIARERARDEATRALDDEITRTVSSLTGLRPERPAPAPSPPVSESPIRLEGSIR